tara:strand:- start:4008 stop:4181 length:174 start_codon:yes stop_codon:yes gene_type:complete
MNKTKTTTTDAIEEMTAEITGALERLREGDYYGDPLPDAIADIAKSLRILSGREKLD